MLAAGTIPQGYRFRAPTWLLGGFVAVSAGIVGGPIGGALAVVVLR
jgi:hypothetical protein